MDLIKTWMPNISAPTLPAFRLPRLHPHLHSAQSTSAISSSATCATPAAATSIAQNLRSESCRLLNRISDHLFGPRHSATSREAANKRQTIQTDYISTISSLVDRSQPDAAGCLPVPTHVVHDAQSENFGLYALKCNRSGRGRGMLDAPALVASMPIDDYTAQHPDDLIGEHYDIRPERPPKRPPPPPAKVAPTKQRAPQPTDKRAAPRITIDPASPRNLVAEAENNGRAKLELDTVYLEPLLLEQTVDLVSATADICCSLNAQQQPTALNGSPPHVAQPVCTEWAAVHANRHVELAVARHQLLQQFANFAEELSNSPVQQINGGCPVSPRTVYVERFSRAFTAAFSADEGVADSQVSAANASASQPTSASETLQQTTVANKSVADSYAASDLIRNNATAASTSAATCTSVAIAGECISSSGHTSSPALSSSNSSSSSLPSSCTLTANGCDVAVAGNPPYRSWLPMLSDSDGDGDNGLAAAAPAAPAAAAEMPPDWGGRHKWEQWSPQAAFYTCSPILEALNDEDEDCDDGEYDSDGTGNGNCHGSGDDAVYLSVGNDINENAIGPGTQQRQRCSSASACQAAFEVHRVPDMTAICPEPMPALMGDRAKWEPWTPTKTVELASATAEPQTAPGQLDNNDNYDGCSVVAPTIVRRLVYVVDL